MRPKVKVELQTRLDDYLRNLADVPNLMTGDEIEELKLLISVMTMDSLQRIASHLEDGQIAVLDAGKV